MADSADGSSKREESDRLPEVQPSWRRKSRNRTAAAASDLWHALRADFASFASRLGRRLRRSREAEPVHDGAAPPRRRRSYLTRLAGGLALLVLLGLLAFAGVLFWALSGIPFEEAAENAPGERTVLLEASDGSPMGRIGALTSTETSLDAYPDHLIDAVIAIEDQRFRQHFGVDPLGIIRALHRNLEAGRIVEGGSTITQQLVKMRYLSSERSLTRKLREAATAIWLETRLSKDEILARYFNRVYLGAGTYGMAAAARLYFDKAPADLTLAESALLAGLIKAPSRYNPLRDLEAARERARVVLDAMAEIGAITAEAASQAKVEPAAIDQPAVASPAGSWFADWVGREALNLVGTLEDGVRVRTTLIPEYQRIAERIIRDTLAENAGRGVRQAALLAMRPNGAVVAMVGGREYDNSQFNRAVQAKRQPGSAFKLFVYMAALRQGLSLEDTVDSTAPQIKGWKPSNFGDRQYGRVTLAEAFAQSINTASVNLALEVGLENVIQAARDLGIEAPLQPLPSIALGSEEVSLLSLTSAYAGVLSGRAPVEPWGVAAFSPRGQGRYMSVSPPEAADTLGPVREKLIELLQLPVQEGTAQAAALDGFAAGKTGTSQEHRDAWFIGFTGSLIVGVWVGNDENEPMERVSGGTVPAAIWKAFMTETGEGREGGADAVGPMALGEAAPPPAPSEEAERGLPIPPDEPAAQPGSGVEGLEPAAGSAAPESEAPHCDIRACSSTYQSFDPSDCTYQPYGGGPRARCEKGDSAPAAQAAAESGGAPEQGQAAQEAGAQREVNSDAICNVSACARFYSSFRASDCTYQPYGGGPRQVCDR